MRRGSCRRRRGLPTAPAPRRPACVHRSASAARAQRVRSASAARRRTSTPTPQSRRARSRRRRSHSSRDAGTPMARARRARAGTPRAASPRGVLVGGTVMGDDGDGTNPVGGEGPGRREGRRPIHARASRAARRNAPPQPAQRRVRQTTRPAGSMAIPSANDPTRASATRASERTYMAVVFSRACATRRALLYQSTQLCRDARAPLARRPPPRRAQPATPDTTRKPPPPAPVPACVAACARAYAQCGVCDGEARRLRPLYGPSASHARMARREGGRGSEGHSSPHPTTPCACTWACRCRMSERQKRRSPTRVM